MKLKYIIGISLFSLILSGCQLSKPTPTPTPTAKPETTTGNPTTDLQEADKIMGAMDESVDFSPFTTTDLE